MKNIVSLAFAGAFGGLITLGGLQLVNSRTTDSQQKSSLAKFTSNVNIPAAAGTIDLASAAASATPAVVYIEAAESSRRAQMRQQQEMQQDPFGGFFGFRQPQKRGTGSGVIISADGYIVTNNHVIDYADVVNVTISDDRKFKAKVIGTDPKHDLAVLKIDASDLTYARRGNSDEIRVGEWVLAIGNPYQLRTTVTAGIISAKGKKLDIYDNEDKAIDALLQTDAVVNPGNSGGALVDVQGRLVGINSAIESHTGSYEGYSFAIPINLVSKVVDEIIKHPNAKPNEFAAAVGRPFLGIQMVSDKFFAEAAQEKGITAKQGVIVDKVVDGGSAQYAGVLPNDVITQINGQPLRSSAELVKKMSSSKVGDVLTLTVQRGERVEKIPVTLKDDSGGRE